MSSRKSQEAEVEFIPCTPKFLQVGEVEAAAATAIGINPANAPVVQFAIGQEAVIPPPSHLAVLTGKRWSSSGVRLTVGFMESLSEALKKKLLAYLNRWDERCNAQFVWSTVDPQVRITRSGQGYWSYLGTDILHIPKGQATMCLQGFTENTPDSEWERVPTHEAGHTLGFPHEHARRSIIEQLDPQKTIALFQATQGWNAQMVYQQILTPLEERSYIGTPTAEEDSIMTYSFPGSITRSGRPIVGGKRITESDFAFAASIYPEEVIPKPDKPELTGLNLSMDFDKKTVSLSLPSGWKVVKQ